MERGDEEKAVCGNRIRIAASAATLCLLTWVSAFGAAGDKAQAKGVIIFRAGEILTVSGSDGKVTVVLTDDTDKR